LLGKAWTACVPQTPMLDVRHDLLAPLALYGISRRPWIDSP
jgi:hypothetical protein